MTELNSPPLQVERLPDELIVEAAEVMAHAFADGHIYSYIFQGTYEYRVEMLTWLFERNIIAMRIKDPDVALCVRDPKAKCSNGSSISEDKGEVKQLLAAFMLVRGDLKLTKWDMVKVGLLSMPYKAGFAATMRMLQVSDWFDERMKTFYNTPSNCRVDTVKKDHYSGDSEATVGRSKAQTETEYYILERMTVRPKAQGLGVGSLCLQHSVNMAKESATRPSIRLSTQQKRTSDWYYKHGFTKIVGTDVLHTAEGLGDRAIDSWFMEYSAS